MEPNKTSLNSLILSTVSVIAVEIAARVAIGQGIFIPLFGIGLARICQIGLLILIVLRSEKSLTSIGIDRSNMAHGLKQGLTWSACFGIAASLTFGIFLLAGVNALELFRTPLASGRGGIVFFFLIGAIIAPISEEIFFRGILYGFFRQWGFMRALILSTILFVLPHLAAHGIPITQIVGGLMFAAAYEVEKNLIVPIVIHSLGNTAIFAIAFIA